MVAEVMHQHRLDLENSRVRVDVLTIASDDESNEEPVLKLHGYPCAAVVKILGPKDRAKGLGDAEIVIDEIQWNALPRATQAALLHHELYHLELVRNGSGKVKLDEYRRPKLKMRLHDRQFGWFDEVARIHGTASMEVRQASALVLSGKQLYFAFALAGESVGADADAEVVDAAA
jgi:hypothetical protein